MGTVGVLSSRVQCFSSSFGLS